MPQIFGKVNRDRPAANTENSQVQPRLARYGEQVVQEISSSRFALAEEGSYFSAVNPTPGTGIAHTIRASFSATDAIFHIRNTGSGGEYLFMDYIRLIPTVIPAAATRSELLIAVDTSSRYSSGGTALTPVNRNVASAQATVATVRFGALVLAAEGGGTRRVSRAQIGTTIPVAFEETFIRFGGETAASGAIGSTVGVRKGVPVGPVAIGNGHDLILHLWHPGNATTAGTWEVEAGWWER